MRAGEPVSLSVAAGPRVAAESNLTTGDPVSPRSADFGHLAPMFAAATRDLAAPDTPVHDSDRDIHDRRTGQMSGVMFSSYGMPSSAFP
jgi:hypothetical protein